MDFLTRLPRSDLALLKWECEHFVSPTDDEVPVDPAHATEDAGYIERTHDLRPLDFSDDEPWDYEPSHGDFL